MADMWFDVAEVDIRNLSEWFTQDRLVNVWPYGYDPGTVNITLRWVSYYNPANTFQNIRSELQ